jgi:LuxR family maltose regulon positive regulatory protein
MPVTRRHPQVGPAIQPGKVAPPPLRADTLSRPRLNDWLAAKIHHRVVLLVAEAGYGKTTLLADFGRTTRQPMAWYRLDEDDRDPVVFAAHVVAAGRAIDPGFGPETTAAIEELARGAVGRDAIVRTLARELHALPPGTILVLDDWHLVDGSSEVRTILREVIRGGPERLTLVMATRRRPTLPLARLRAQGEVIELTTDALRFRLDETERLFRDAYGLPLEADVLAELDRRTEGWAASLQLVRAAVAGRSSAATREFVRGLEGSHEELYDLLAEEVVGELDPDRQRLLMELAVLQAVDVDLAVAVSGRAATDVREHLDAAETTGLLGRRVLGGRRSLRYHPLVAEFLLERLRREIGDDGVADLHRRVAAYATGRDWRLAAHHLAAANEVADLHRVLADSAGEIVASGELARAEGYLERFPPAAPDPALEIIVSRLDFYRNDVRAALARATWAAEHARPDLRAAARANLASVAFMSGDIALASASIPVGEPDVDSEIARAIRRLISSGFEGDSTEFIGHMTRLLATQERLGQTHYAAITSLNIAVAYKSQGQARLSLEYAHRALNHFGERGGQPERASACVTAAWAHAHLGELDRADVLIAEALTVGHGLTRTEVQTEAAELHTWYGDAERARSLLAAAGETSPASASLHTAWRAAAADFELRVGHPHDALAHVDSIAADGAFASTGQLARALAVRARAATRASDGTAIDKVRQALSQAGRQGTPIWGRYVALAEAAARGRDSAAAVSDATLREDPAVVSMLAEDLAPHLSSLDTSVGSPLHDEIARRPQRWRPLLRDLVASGHSAERVAAGLLDEIGETQDIALLRRFARRHRRVSGLSGLGRGLARRLAPHIHIEDLGRVVIWIGDTRIDGASVRRKVLSMLIFLASRPQMAATREQVLEALWPDLDPHDAVNSMNQTLYFLRRVFEPAYSDDTSPGYVNFDAEILWLDAGLITTQSGACRDILRRVTPSPTNPASEPADELLGAYHARFALDFEYDDWAADYRDWLHSSFLEVIEREVNRAATSGDFGRALDVARRAGDVDRATEALQLLVVRLSRAAGTHAAAAERYTAYASMLQREYGEDAPPIARTAFEPSADR